MSSTAARVEAFVPPIAALGADLFWWRESDGFHTIVTVHSLAFEGILDADVVLDCILFDASGVAKARWDVPMRGRAFCSIDSARLDEFVADAPHVPSGTLAIYVHGRLVTDRPYLRLFSMLDWYSDRGDIAGLHNDQSVVRGRNTEDVITEISILETTGQHNSLVVVNGEEPLPGGAVSVTVTNSGGAQRRAAYGSPLAPFTAHRLRLAELFPGLDAFGDGAHLSVTGTIQCRGQFVRPYVITEGERFSAYHGGDRYDFAPLPALHYRLLGNGEVNPMAVVHRPGEIQTVVNLFNSHGDLDESFWVDAELFDATGNRVARRERWRCARRHEIVRAEVAELLPDSGISFSGHIALSFSPVEGEVYPRRLQALLEYQSTGGAAHVMAWSDEWNSRLRMHSRARHGALPLRSFFRALAGRGFTTTLSVTNAGHSGYRESASCTITLVNARSERQWITHSLAPYATLFDDLPVLFPGAEEFLAPSGVGVVEVDSTFDLANVQFVRHASSGAWAAEHYLPVASTDGDRIDIAAGS